MQVSRVTPEEYLKIVEDRIAFFNEPRFCELNKGLVDEVHYLIIKKENSLRFGLIVGIKDGVVKCPFSAPYSFPVVIGGQKRIADYDDAVDALEEYLRGMGVKTLNFMFPPLLYDEHNLSAWISAFYRRGYSVTNLDLNYSIDLKVMNVPYEKYLQLIPQKARPALRNAVKRGLSIERCETEKQYREAYDIIVIGHEAKGYPTKLTFERLMDTMKLIDHDVFIVRYEGVGIVGTVHYRINDKVVQVIYTGTHPDYMDCNGMNLLTYHTVNYFGDMGYEILDMATGTENSEPNHGLCNFKESVGYRRSLKYSFTKDLCADGRKE